MKIFPGLDQCYSKLGFATYFCRRPLLAVDLIFAIAPVQPWKNFRFRFTKVSNLCAYQKNWHVTIEIQPK